MQECRLDEIASIFSGLSTGRHKGSDNESAPVVKTISVKDIDPDSSILKENIGEEFRLSDMKAIKKFTLENDDIVITAKGTSIRSAIYKDCDSKVIPTSNLTIIKCDSGTVSPDYLVTFLNAERTIADIQSRLSGTTIMSLNKKELSALKVKIPSLEEQERIVNIVREKENFIKARKSEIENMEKLIDHTVNQAIYKEEK